MLDHERLWLLGLMGVLAAGINPQIGHLLTRQTVAGQHALNRFGDNALRMGTFKDLACGA
jgi:hypothetical protein